MDNENVATRESRDLLTRIIKLTNPAGNSSVIHLEHESYAQEDTSTCIRYAHKATIDFLLNEGVISIRNKPLENERTSATWKYKVIVYRDKAQRLLKKLGLSVSTLTPQFKNRPTISLDGFLQYKDISYQFRNTTDRRYRIMRLLCERFGELVMLFWIAPIKHSCRSYPPIMGIYGLRSFKMFSMLGYWFHQTTV